MKAEIFVALSAASDGYSPDRVVADPQLNGKFVAECRRLGLDQSPGVLNRALLNLRKRGDLAGNPRSRKTSFPDLHECRFASEVAARFLEQRHNISLDDIICDPQMAAELDQVAADIAPGFDSVHYRWAALNLRKARKLRPEIVSRIATFDDVRLGRLEDIDVESIPRQQGVYIFYSPAETLYIGESANLRKRLRRHVDHSDNKGLARWFWQHGITDARLEVRLLPEATATRVRRAVESELIASRHPRFNCSD
ncbi:MAG TPA: GIY-YIG nuclease family protein [Pirellulales bacterium]|nr:GIY-YIG nuclease family protein [Pirellulales bacterium]